MYWRTAELEFRFRPVALLWLAVVLIGLAGVLWLGNPYLLHEISQSPWAIGHQTLLSAISDYGMYPFYGLFLALLLLGWWRRRSDLRIIGWGYLVAQLIGAVLTVRLLKIMIGQARPKTAQHLEPAYHWIGPTLDNAYHSFPSGHTADLFTSAIFTSLLLPAGWQRQLCFGFAVLVGLTRIALYEHYPLDVVSGAFIGGLASLLTIRLWLLPRLHRL